MKRSSIYISLYAFAFILLLGSVGMAIAEDFTFNVPVALYNMPAAYQSGKVRCTCSIINKTNSGSVSSKTGIVDSGNLTVGASEKEFPITNGAYVGAITIKFNANSNTTPASATDWSCVLLLFDKSRNGWNYADIVMRGAYNRTKPYYPSDKGYLK